MENIIRGTTPSLVVDFADITDFDNEGVIIRNELIQTAYEA